MRLTCTTHRSDADARPATYFPGPNVSGPGQLSSVLAGQSEQQEEKAKRIRTTGHGIWKGRLKEY